MALAVPAVRAVHAGRVGQVVPAAAGRAPRARYLPIAEHGLIGWR